MKHLLLLITIGLALTSCSKEDALDEMDIAATKGPTFAESNKGKRFQSYFHNNIYDEADDYDAVWVEVTPGNVVIGECGSRYNSKTITSGDVILINNKTTLKVENEIEDGKRVVIITTSGNTLSVRSEEYEFGSLVYWSESDFNKVEKICAAQIQASIDAQAAAAAQAAIDAANLAAQQAADALAAQQAADALAAQQAQDAIDAENALQAAIQQAADNLAAETLAAEALAAQIAAQDAASNLATWSTELTGLGAHVFPGHPHGRTFRIIQNNVYNHYFTISEDGTSVIYWVWDFAPNTSRTIGTYTTLSEALDAYNTLKNQ